MKPFVILLSLLLMCGCESHSRSTRSNVMEYLYPKDTEAPLPNPQGARLQLPLSIGIAFVPSQTGRYRDYAIAGFDEKPLLEVVRKSFIDRPWVKQIKIIPSSYLTPQGGFDNLEQVGRLYQVDVIVLVSVDQIQYSDPNLLSLTYYSIVGAYVLPGNTNDTRTLIDAAAFDVNSRVFLLRAPGQSHLGGHSTGVGDEAALRRKSHEGLQVAMTDLAKNLDEEVNGFKAEVQSGERKEVTIIDREGRSLRAGGAAGFWEAVVASGLCLALIMRRRV